MIYGYCDFCIPDIAVFNLGSQDEFNEPNITHFYQIGGQTEAQE